MKKTIALGEAVYLVAQNKRANRRHWHRQPKREARARRRCRDCGRPATKSLTENRLCDSCHFYDSGPRMRRRHAKRRSSRIRPLMELVMRR